MLGRGARAVNSRGGVRVSQCKAFLVPLVTLKETSKPLKLTYLNWIITLVDYYSRLLKYFVSAGHF